MNILESEYYSSPKATKAKRRRIKQKLKAKKETAKTKKELASIQANLVAIDDAHSRRPRCAYSVSYNKWMQPHMNGSGTNMASTFGY